MFFGENKKYNEAFLVCLVICYCKIIITLTALSVERPRCLSGGGAACERTKISNMHMVVFSLLFCSDYPIVGSNLISKDA